MRKTILVALAAVLASTPAYAGVKYAAYEGNDAIKVGEGGTKVIEKGIEFWTSGSPPRKFQVLGVLTDKRDDKPITRLFGGDAIGSKGIAKKVLEVGGNAVIVLDQNERGGGLAGFISNGHFGAREVTVTTTQFLVVKYLAD